MNTKSIGVISYMQNYVSSLVDWAESFDKITTDEIHDIVELLYKRITTAPGKVYLTGTGKNIYLLESVSAIMCMLNIPAQTIPANEMLHGKLGVLASNDLLIAVSKSGNTDDVSMLMEHVRINNLCETVGISFETPDFSTNNFDHTTLYHLKLPYITEVDQFGIIPSTSILGAQIVLNSIAFAVAEKMGYDIDKLKQNHPAGTIGKNLNKQQ